MFGWPLCEGGLLDSEVFEKTTTGHRMGWEVHAVIQCLSQELVLSPRMLVAFCSNIVVLVSPQGHWWVRAPTWLDFGQWCGCELVLASLSHLVSIVGCQIRFVLTSFQIRRVSLQLRVQTLLQDGKGLRLFSIVERSTAQCFLAGSDVGPIAQPHGKSPGAVTQCNRAVFQIGAALWAYIKILWLTSYHWRRMRHLIQLIAHMALTIETGLRQRFYLEAGRAYLAWRASQSWSEAHRFDIFEIALFIGFRISHFFNPRFHYHSFLIPFRARAQSGCCISAGTDLRSQFNLLFSSSLLFQSSARSQGFVHWK